jgi:hypothetical protein
MRRPIPFLLAGLLLSATACGGSTPSAPSPANPVPVAPAHPATSLAYVDPPGSGWRLVRDPSSTSTRVVLNLVGPAGQKTRGVGFNLKAPAGVKFGAFEGGLPIRDTGAYELLSSVGDPNEPVALVGGVKAGNLLSVGIYQKDRTHAAKDSGTTLCQIALTLDPSAPPAQGALPLGVPKAKVIPEDIGSTTDETWLLDRKMQMAGVTVAVGTLTGN